MTAINGRWIVYDITNLDELLEAYGMPAEKRDVSRKNMRNHTFIFDSPDGVTCNLTNIYPSVERKMTYTAGQEFVYTFAGGKTANAIFKKVSDNTFDLVFKSESGEANIKVEVSGSELTMTTNFKNVSSVAKYKKQ